MQSALARAPALRAANGRLVVATMLALALHGVALFHSRPASGALQPRAAAAAMSVRLLPFISPKSDAPASLAAVPSAQPPAVPAVHDPAEARPGSAAAARIADATPIAGPAKQAAPDTSGQRQQAAPAGVAESSAGPPTGGLPTAPDYLFAARLDPGPRPLGEIEPEFPAEAERQEGSVVLRLLISEKGAVDDVAVVRSTPPGLFDHAALEAFGAAKFAPGLVSGVPVKAQLMIEVQFVPFNRGARISGRSY